MLNEIHTHLLNLSFPQIITKGFKIKLWSGKASKTTNSLIIIMAIACYDSGAHTGDRAFLVLFTD